MHRNVVFMSSASSVKSDLFDRLSQKQPNQGASNRTVYRESILEDRGERITLQDIGSTDIPVIITMLNSAAMICMVADLSNPQWSSELETYLESFPFFSDPQTLEQSSVLLIGNKQGQLSQEEQESFEQQYRVLFVDKYNCRDKIFVPSDANQSIDRLKEAIFANVPSLTSHQKNMDDKFHKNSQNEDNYQLFTAFEELYSFEDFSLEDFSLSDDDEIFSARIATSEAINKHSAESGNEVVYNLDNPNFAFALRLLGLALLLIAAVNVIYLLLVLANLLSAVAVTAAVNQVWLVVGSLLGFAAPALSFAQAAAAIGLTETAASVAVSTTGSLLLAGIGYGLFGSQAQSSVATFSIPTQDENDNESESDSMSKESYPLEV